MTKTELQTINQVLSGEHWTDNLSGLRWTPQLKDSLMAKHLHEVKLWRARKR